MQPTPSRALAVLAALVAALTWWPTSPAGADERRLGPGDDLAGALADLRAGDTLVLEDGVHVLDAQLDLTASGAPGRPITIRGAGGRERVEVTGSGRIHFTNATRWVVEGVSFTSVPLRLISEDDRGRPFDSLITDNRFTGHGIQLQNAGSVEITGNHFADVRSLEMGQDRHAIHLVGASGDLAIRDNLVENASADSIQAQGLVDNVLVEGNEFRVNRPHPADDPFCSTGENAIDVKRAERWVIRDNHFHGFQVVPGCDGFDATSEGGEAIVIHKHGARDFEITGNRFVDNSVHLLILGKTCIDGGEDCSGDLRSERIDVRDNEFRNETVDSRTIGVKITPGVGVADLQPPVGPVDVTVAANTFVGLDLVVDVVVKEFDNAEGDEVRTRPEGIVVEDNDYDGGRLKLAAAAGVTANGNTETAGTAGRQPSDPAPTSAPPTTTPPTTPPPSTTPPTTASPPTTAAASAAAPATAPSSAPTGLTPAAGDDATLQPADPESVAEPELGSSFPWPWFVATGLMILAAAVGLAVWRARTAT